jgi:hypothetical protein
LYESNHVKTIFSEIWKEGAHHLFVLVYRKGNAVPFYRRKDFWIIK